jgi:hypothetical protein
MTQSKETAQIWDQYQDGSYIDHNYRHGVLPEDAEIIKTMMRGYRRLGIKPYSLERIAEIGNGGTFQYAGVEQRVVAEKPGAIDYIEYRPTGVKLAADTIQCCKATGDSGCWSKFGDVSLAEDRGYGVGPSGWPIHPTRRALNLGCAVAGSIYELPEQEYDMVVSPFCAESITDKREEWEEGTERFVGSVKIGGLVVMACMLESEGYGTPDPEGTLIFPAYPVTTEIVQDRLARLGVGRLEVVPINAPLGARPADGPQYAGMCLAMGIRE